MKRRIFISSLLVLLTFIIGLYGKTALNSYISLSFSSIFLKLCYSYFWWGLPSILLLGVLYGFKTILFNLGLNKGIIVGLIFSTITVLPMFVGFSVIGRINTDLNLGILFHKTIIAGFFEEYFFRGFLFGILFRKLKWGFIPSSLIGGLFFGLGHIYQGSSFIETIGVFAITSIGAVWFSWLYIEWENNLWIPIFLHILMNLSWDLFDVGNNALGDLFTNLFRAITIALTILITIRYHKKRGLAIKLKNIIINNNS